MRRVTKAWIVALCFGLGMASSNLQAADITVTKAGSGKISIEIAALKTKGKIAKVFKATLAEDLKRSGWFSIAQRKGFASVKVTGSAQASTDHFQVQCQVSWGTSSQFIWQKSGPSSTQQARAWAHKLSDRLTSSVAGKKGMAGAKVVMIGKRGGVHELYTCDTDGRGVKAVTSDRKVCVGPKWGPNGRRIYYTGFLKRYPDIYRIDLDSKRRDRIVSFPGLNTGAVISPNGEHMAVILSRTGNPELYIMNVRSRKLSRLTYTRSASEASPSWSPDGSSLVYVSDSSGRPQLYLFNENKNQAVRLTRQGRENVSPDWGDDGRIACASKVGGRYQIAIINPRTKAYKLLGQTADGADYEDPTWAPDNRHIICTRTSGHKSKLYLLDTLGDPSIPLLTLSGEWMAPDCSGVQK